MKEIGIRALYAVAFVAFFAMFLRPGRDAITGQLLHPAAISLHNEAVPVTFYYFGGPGFYIVRTDVQGDWQRNAEDRSARTAVGVGSQTVKNSFSFRGFGDKFFSLGALYFLLFGFGWKPVMKLYAIHVGVTMLSLLCIYFGITHHPAWLYPMNLLVTYITPAATGMFVLMSNKRSTKTA
jgi:hypothetical protein